MDLLLIERKVETRGIFKQGRERVNAVIISTNCDCNRSASNFTFLRFSVLYWSTKFGLTVQYLTFKTIKQSFQPLTVALVSFNTFIS